ncbi:MAG: c-type cytochrome [Mariprofundaceae bacterium]
MVTKFISVAALILLSTSLASATTALPDGKALFSNQCASCHAADGTVSKYGKTLKPFPARNLRAIASYVSADELRRIITHGTHKSAMRAMKYKLTALEIEALVDHIKTFDYTVNMDSGKQRFKQVCASCHGNDGRAKTGMGAKNLTYSKLSIEDLVHTIRYGRPGTLMSAKRHQISNIDIANIANHVFSLRHAGDAKKGNKLFNSNCQSCHATPAKIRLIGNAARPWKSLTDVDDHMLNLRIRHGRHIDRAGKKAIKGLSEDDVQDIILYLRKTTH